jgi:hypothetical protein
MATRLLQTRLTAALRAGATAYAVAILFAALLAAPLIADRSIGHLHADGVEAHVHPITQLLTADGPAAAPPGAPSWIVLLTLVAVVVGPIARRPLPRVRSRGPPPTG